MPDAKITQNEGTNQIQAVAIVRQILKVLSAEMQLPPPRGARHPNRIAARITEGAFPCGRACGGAKTGFATRSRCP